MDMNGMDVRAARNVVWSAVGSSVARAAETYDG